MPKNRDNENEEFSVRFIEVRVKGSSETLQSAIRSVADAVGGRPIITRVVQSPALPTGNKVVDDQQPALELDDVQEGEFAGDASDIKPVDAKPKRERTRTVSNPKPLDMDLNSGTMPFEKLCQEKKPSSDREKYLVIAYWFKQYQNTPLIKNNHVLTCFLGMKWEVPKDLRTCFRALERDSLVKSHKDGLWEITFNGISDINKMGA